MNSNPQPKPAERLFFVFYGRSRPRVTLSGVARGVVFEARAYPSLEYATGETWEDAKSNLRELLDNEISNASVPAEHWYAAKVRELNDDDRKALFASAFKALTRREEFESFTVGSIKSLFLDEVEDLPNNEVEEAPCGRS